MCSHLEAVCWREAPEFTSRAMELLARAKRAFDSIPRFAKTGLPFIAFVIGGSFFLKEFAELRYEFRKSTSLDPRELEAAGLQKRDPSETTIEAVYEEIKNLDTDNWENIRGPRMHEEGGLDTLETIKKKAAARRKEQEEAARKKILDA
ncbi:cytochrome c oxidase assembly protein COX16 homolog, mitochondrial [Galendromus occidentalis]|uniref:Cytochrome c oxidase assembly protein COX16 homolog, mitochondrial n=1 Tax=Galendromus occidentalis TaxID=34638 RepID=A0AAJ6QPM8_9ACAR|nr:cytochrome c oxidase assembly protein COX16 homolog, mitochondrial [Galendromus occidentalis]